MQDANALKAKIKDIMVENLMLQVPPSEIGDDMPLFGPGSLGLDSVDALQLVVALDKTFGLKIPDPASAKETLQSVNTITTAVERKLAASGQSVRLQLLEKNPEANALVLFAGLPPFSPPLAQRLAARSVKLLAVCGYSPNVRRWPEARALAVAVVPRFGELPPGTPAPKTAKGLYVLVA